MGTARHIAARSLFVFLSFVPFCELLAQVDNTYLSDHIEVNRADSAHAGLSLSAFNYMRNTEYFNNIELGRTLFGYQLNPSLFYQPNRTVKLQAGVFLRNDFGSNYVQVLPTYTLKFEHRNLSVLFGTLEGALAHRMLEPMMNISSAIENRIENGFQFTYSTDRQGKLQSPEHYYHAWINWERFIERGANHKEGFTAGLNLEPRFLAHWIGLYPVFQAMMTHRGGQIDKDSLDPLTMQLNTAVGLKCPLGIAQTQRIMAEAYILKYHETSGSGLWPFNDGQAVYANLSYSTWQSSHTEYDGRNFTCMLSYWNAVNFLAPRGSYIYQSQSIDVPSHFESRRELFLLRFLYRQPLFASIFMSARFEPVYDLQNKIFDYSYSFYLSYRKNLVFRKGS